ncbi:MAG TPA: type II toxin-antitoxin system MqsA family antitoxin [Methanoregulaceae archaeon]|nr:type II toxin-antitoxin system MqsA family antitoxin [Methanoregulaceae archaeon]
MIPGQCSLCYGKLQEGKTDFLAQAGGEAIVIKDVPAHICEQCGKTYYTVSISRKMDEFMYEAQTKKLCMQPVPEEEVSLYGQIPAKKK